MGCHHRPFDAVAGSFDADARAVDPGSAWSIVFWPSPLVPWPLLPWPLELPLDEPPVEDVSLMFTVATAVASAVAETPGPAVAVASALASATTCSLKPWP